MSQNLLNSAAPLIGRILLAQLFVVAGIRKIMYFGPTNAYFGKLGLPMPEVTTAIVIAIEFIGGAMLLTGKRMNMAACVLAAFTLAATYLGHAFWTAEPAQFANQLNHFLKNLAIVGGLLLLVPLAARKSR